MAKPKGLGRGLDSLLSAGIEEVGASDRLTQLAVGSIKPGRYQPRSQMAGAGDRRAAPDLVRQRRHHEFSAYRQGARRTSGGS